MPPSRICCRASLKRRMSSKTASISLLSTRVVLAISRVIFSISSSEKCFNTLAERAGPRAKNNTATFLNPPGSCFILLLRQPGFDQVGQAFGFFIGQFAEPVPFYLFHLLRFRFKFVQGSLIRELNSAAPGPGLL